MSAAIWTAVIIGAWVAVLLPAARRSHESVAGLRSIDRFHGAMRVLSRRGDSRWVVMPPGARTGRSSRPVTNNRPPVRPAVRSGAARRRKTLLALLAGAAAATLLAVALGSIWLWASVVSWLVVLAGVAGLRAAAAAEHRVRLAQARARRAEANRLAQIAAGAPTVWSPATGPVPVVPHTFDAAALAAMPHPEGAPAVSQLLPVVPHRVATVAVPSVAPAEPEEWIAEPLSGVRVLDLTTPGGWRRTRLFESAEEPELEALRVDDEVPLRRLG